MKFITTNNCKPQGRATRIGAKYSAIGNVLINVDRPDDHHGHERVPVWLTRAQAKQLRTQLDNAIDAFVKRREVRK